MQHCVNIFIGEGFASMFKSVGEIVLSQHEDAIKYNNYLKVTESKDAVEFQGLRLHELAAQDLIPGTQIDVLGDRTQVKKSDLSTYWSDSIFDKILTVGASGQDTLYVFIHLPLYRKECFGTAKLLCQAIKEAERPVVMNFIGYGDDLVKFVEPEVSGKFVSAKESVAEIKEIYKEFNYVPQYNKFVFLQNRSLKGVSIFNEDDTCLPLYDLVANLSILLSSYYDDVFSMTDVSPRDVVGVGFSSICFDRYRFASYLLQKAMLKSIDNQSVNNNDVDVNQANTIVVELLKNKDHILSSFCEKWRGRELEGPNYNEIKDGLEDIYNSVVSRFKKDRDMTAKTAVLASLLSKTECELFSSTFYNIDSITFDDLYSEAVDYYVREDAAGYYKLDGERLVNPISELKSVNRKLIQAEVMVRNLKEQMDSYEEQIEKNDKVTECFIDDGFFKFGDHKFKMLPSVDEAPLEETYKHHDVYVDSVDLRCDFSRIKNQGQQGSCLAFSLTSVFEYVLKVNQKEECDLSEAFLYYNARNLDEDGTVSEDGGSRFVPSLESLRRYGIALERHWPYNESVFDTKPNQAAYDDAATRKLVKALNVERDVNAIKSALSDGYPVACSFTLFESFSSAGAYIPVPTESEISQMESGDEQWKHSHHAMVIVGYSDKLQRFLVRNSWGEDWGDNGYCYLPYEYVSNPKLLNFACIISEVASIESVLPKLKKVPALEINNADVEIRYYVAQAAYALQQKLVSDLRARRLELIDYFERQKYIYSDANARDEFIEANKRYLEDDISELKQIVKDCSQKQDEIFDEFCSKRKRTIIAASVVATIATALVLLWNRLVGDKLDISLLWILAIWGFAALVFYIFFRQYYNNWREERDVLKNKIDSAKKKIAEDEKRISLFRHNTNAAWTTVTTLGAVYRKLENLYSKMVSLINNLRVWYEETANGTTVENFSSPYPNVSILCKERLDSFFEENVSACGVCDFDLCEDIDAYQATPEYLSAYKSGFRDALKHRLFDKLDQINFNMSEHLASEKFSAVAADINSEILESWERMAGIMIHAQSSERAVITTDNLIFAPNLNAVRYDLMNKLSNLSSASYYPMNDNYKISLVRVATLKFDECVAFKETKPRK